MLLEQGVGNERSNGKMKNGNKSELEPYSSTSPAISWLHFQYSVLFSFLISLFPVLVPHSWFPVLVTFVHAAGR